jgi:hypothetical protein
MIPPRPDEGHLSNRASIGIGYNDGDLFQDILYRFAYHTLIDLDDGYIEGGQIVFGDIGLRYYSCDRKLELNKLDVINIISLSPRDNFIRSISWKVDTGLSRKLLLDGNEQLVYELNGGAGLSYKGFPGIFFIMADGEINVARDLADNYALGLGASTGLISKITGFWNSNLIIRNLYYGLGEARNELSFTLREGFSFSANTAMVLDACRKDIFDKHLKNNFHQYEYKLNFNLFF